MSAVGILIPTWNNPQYLFPCIQSILQYTIPDDLFHIYIINNGDPKNMEPYEGNPYITVLQQKENMGWEGGLKAGLAASKEPYVLLMNDDTLIQSHQRMWLNALLQGFSSPSIAAVGPTSNVVMGRQNTFTLMRESLYRAKFLIGFCMLVKRADLDSAGGIDDTLPGGDDLDLSIRLRKLGKHLLINREVFVWHHGFKTGTRVKGAEWNSVQMTERTNHALIRKHGLRAFLDLWGEEPTPEIPFDKEDTEQTLVERNVVGDKVLEIGCGHKKTVPHAVGIDMVRNGVQIPGLAKGLLSACDHVGDAQDKLPVDPATFDTVIARHVLEHMVDPVKALRHWGDALKPGGRVIIAVPNHDIRNSIPMNWQHVHAYTPRSLREFMESLGWKTVSIEDPDNFVSFVGVWEKNGLH